MKKTLLLFFALSVVTLCIALANEPEKIYKGDINGDGKVDTLDFELIAKHFTGEIEPLSLADADVNGDGEINSLDINAAYQEYFYIHGREEDSLALVAIYNSLNGPLWKDNTNWCSDKPIDEWYGVTVLNNRVWDLYLSNNNLIGDLPAEIGNLSALDQLSIGYNSIKSIHDNIVELRRLTSLSLSYNPIHTLPASLGNLKNLRTLRVEGNNLTELPSWLFNLTNLEFLYAGDNKFTLLPHDIVKLNKLRWLFLSGGELRGTLPAYLAELENLNTMNVTLNYMDGVVPMEIQQHENWDNFKNYLNPQREGHLYLTQEEYDYAHADDAKKEEREALIAIYNALGGDNWVRNDNWCSDKPLSEWYGVEVDEFGHVYNLDFNFYAPSSDPVWSEIRGNNLNGHIPADISKLSHLGSLQIYNAPNLTGALPEEIYDMESLISVIIVNCGLEGTISPNIGKLKNLSNLQIEKTRMSGEIPAEIFSHPNLKSLVLSYNEFTKLPESVIPNPSLKWVLGLSGNKFSGTIPDWLFSFPNISQLNIDRNKFDGGIPKSIGNAKNYEQISLYYNSLSGNIPDELYELDQLQSFLATGNQLEGTISENIAKMGSIRQFWVDENNITGNLPVGVRELKYCEDLFVYDNRMNGSIPAEVLNCDRWKYRWGAYAPTYILKQQEGYGLTIDSTLIVGPDMTHDGEVKQLQQHTKGKGFSIVLMGDGYLDIDGEQYDNDMMKAYNAYFAIEPFKSLKEYFDVYTVRTVSKTRIDGTNGVSYNNTNTALNTSYMKPGDASKCMEYLLKAIPDYDAIEKQAQIIVIKNTNSTTDGITELYPDGFTIAYCGIADGSTNFTPVLQHEACGHGFGLLGDEYFYDVNVSMPEELKTEVDIYMTLGYYKNIDFTNDLSNIKWSTFVNDERYSSENIGAYEGGLEYTNGVYRPTYNSIMRNHWEGDGFNAPSREAIYKRMMEYSYGSDWTYNYDEFVAFDNNLPSNAKLFKKKNDMDESTVKRLPKPIMRNFPSKLIKENNSNSKRLPQLQEEKSVKYQIGNVMYERKGNKVRIVK